jgi:hypothetical protein
MGVRSRPVRIHLRTWRIAFRGLLIVSLPGHWGYRTWLGGRLGTLVSRALLGQQRNGCAEALEPQAAPQGGSRCDEHEGVGDAVDG